MREPASLSVILDMDGLMLDTEVVSQRIWREVARERGVDLPADVLAQMVGLNEASSGALLRQALGPSAPVDQLRALAQVRYRDHLEQHGVAHKPGLGALLEFLRQRAVKRAVATSTARELALRKLGQAGVLRYFDVVVGGDEVAAGKPAPDIFLLAAARLGQDPSACVVLEDSGPGLRGAVAAGMIAILVPDGTPPVDVMRLTAHETARSLIEARGILERLLDGQPKSTEARS